MRAQEPWPVLGCEVDIEGWESEEAKMLGTLPELITIFGVVYRGGEVGVATQGS